MKSAIPSKSPVERDGSGQGVAESTDPSEKGHQPHFLSTSPDTRTAKSRAAWRVVSASAGDHPMIHQFLVSVFHKPSPAEFQAQLEEPSYEPAYRLVIKDGTQIVAHLRLLSREMRLGRLVLPVGIIADLATLPEYRGLG